MINQIKILSKINPFNKTETIQIKTFRSVILLTVKQLGIDDIKFMRVDDVLSAIGSIKKLGIECKKVEKVQSSGWIKWF